MKIPESTEEKATVEIPENTDDKLQLNNWCQFIFPLTVFADHNFLSEMFALQNDVQNVAAARSDGRRADVTVNRVRLSGNRRFSASS